MAPNCHHAAEANYSLRSGSSGRDPWRKGHRMSSDEDIFESRFGSFRNFAKCPQLIFGKCMCMFFHQHVFRPDRKIQTKMRALAERTYYIDEIFEKWVLFMNVTGIPFMEWQFPQLLVCQPVCPQMGVLNSGEFLGYDRTVTTTSCAKLIWR
jgi:hypothetical protein